MGDGRLQLPPQPHLFEFPFPVPAQERSAHHPCEPKGLTALNRSRTELGKIRERNRNFKTIVSATESTSRLT